MREHFCTLCGCVGHGGLEVHDLRCPLSKWYQWRQQERLEKLLGDFTPALQEAA